MTTRCDFCNRDADQYCIIEETEYSYAKICKWPLHDSHTLIIPKRHVIELSELNQEEAVDLLGLVTKFAKKISSIYEQPPKLFQNYGRHRSQPHLHLHLISWKDGLREAIAGTDERIERSKDEMSELATKLK